MILHVLAGLITGFLVIRNVPQVLDEIPARLPGSVRRDSASPCDSARAPDRSRAGDIVAANAAVGGEPARTNAGARRPYSRTGFGDTNPGTGEGGENAARERARRGGRRSLRLEEDVRDAGSGLGFAFRTLSWCSHAAVEVHAVPTIGFGRREHPGTG